MLFPTASMRITQTRVTNCSSGCTVTVLRQLLHYWAGRGDPPCRQVCRG